jgi:hypothetical protein
MELLCLECGMKSLSPPSVAAIPTHTIVTITSEIWLHTFKYNHPVVIKYEIECNLPVYLDFELIFHGSQNIFIMDIMGDEITEKQALKARISPFSKSSLGEIRVEDPSYRSVLKTKYNWKKTTFSEKKINEIALKDKEEREV